MKDFDRRLDFGFSIFSMDDIRQQVTSPGPFVKCYKIPVDEIIDGDHWGDIGVHPFSRMGHGKYHRIRITYDSDCDTEKCSFV